MLPDLECVNEPGAGRLDVECSGIVLAKLDGTAKGGVVVPIRQQFDLPVKFIGVGEGIEDVEPFDAEAFSKAIFS